MLALFKKKKPQQKSVNQILKTQVPVPVVKEYNHPHSGLLNKYESNSKDNDKIYEKAEKLRILLLSHGIEVKMQAAKSGTRIDQYEFTIVNNVSVKKIFSLKIDMQLKLEAESVNIVAPIPGTDRIAVQASKNNCATVYLEELIGDIKFITRDKSTTYCVGKDIAGNLIYSDLMSMPHLLIAGTTGSGKSVFINSIILSLLFKSNPEYLKLILIDPKYVELSVYRDIPHLARPIANTAEEALQSLEYAVKEMDRRYKLMSEAGVKNIKGYNQKSAKKLPYIVIIIDELADLMMVSSKKTEMYICRITQLARAAGIHLVVATQRPTVNVVTGLIKANMPSRISFKVATAVDSKVILDQTGAENLLGNGDMLYMMQGTQPVRIQAPYVSDEEIERVVNYINE